MLGLQHKNMGMRGHIQPIADTKEEEIESMSISKETPDTGNMATN